MKAVGEKKSSNCLNSAVQETQ